MPRRRSDQMGVAWSDGPAALDGGAGRAGAARGGPAASIRAWSSPGPPPLMTPEGILLVYNGADDRLVYRTGWALFDRNDPTRVLARSDTPIFVPERPWELVGQVPNVVFVEGLVREGTRWLFYYGARTRASASRKRRARKEPR